jgi:CubicO group peptidase (beta-lactamase class C family)
MGGMTLFPTRRTPLPLLAAALAAGAAAAQPAPRKAPPHPRLAPGSVPPARFADPGRAAKLAAGFPAVDQAFREFAARSRVPGLAWGVIVDEQLAHTGAVGVRDTAGGGEVGPDTVFRIASMTKSFTALAVLILRDEGRLSLDDPAARFVGELAALPYPTRDSPVLTLRHLLTHSAGLPEDNAWGDRQLAVPEHTLDAWLRAGLPFSSAPGVAYEYSNYGFALLGRIVTRASGMPGRAFVEARILKPLGLTATAWEAASVPPERLARGYGLDGERWVEEPPLADGAFGAMGGLLSSVRDLARYVALYLSAWPPRDDPDTGPARRSSLREMQQAARPFPATARRATVEAPLSLSAGGYGYGLSVTQTCRFRHVVAHSGGLPGFGSHMRWLPEHGVGVVALANRTYAGPGAAVAEVLEALAGTGALEPRVVQPSPALLAARAVVDPLLARWDDGAARDMAADNLFLDRPLERRRREFDDLRARHGACRPETPLLPENALRGEWRMACERGWIRLGLTLAPTQPPRVQSLTATSVLPLGPRLAAAAAALAGRIGGSGALEDLLSPGADREQAQRTMAAAAPWGRCRLGDVERDGGESQASVRFLCDGGPLTARLALDEASGRLRSISLSPAAGVTCVP